MAFLILVAFSDIHHLIQVAFAHKLNVIVNFLTNASTREQDLYQIEFIIGLFRPPKLNAYLLTFDLKKRRVVFGVRGANKIIKFVQGKR